jgi:hypothetical protein
MTHPHDGDDPVDHSGDFSQRNPVGLPSRQRSGEDRGGEQER